MNDDVVQTNASDPEQLEHARFTEKERAKRRRELWRWLLSQGEGREWLWEIGLRELGMFHRIAGSLEEVYGQAALHNLACDWLRTDITPNRELYLQMQNEALRREEQQRRGNRASRVRRSTSS